MEDNGFRGALVDTARMFKLIIEFQAERLGRPEEFNKVAEEFFTSSNEEQNQIIKDFASSGKFKSFGYTKPTDPSLEEQELTRATSLAEAITKKVRNV